MEIRVESLPVKILTQRKTNCNIARIPAPLGVVVFASQIHGIESGPFREVFRRVRTRQFLIAALQINRKQRTKSILAWILYYFLPKFLKVRAYLSGIGFLKTLPTSWTISDITAPKFIAKISRSAIYICVDIRNVLQRFPETLRWNLILAKYAAVEIFWNLWCHCNNITHFWILGHFVIRGNLRIGCDLGTYNVNWMRSRFPAVVCCFTKETWYFFAI